MTVAEDVVVNGTGTLTVNRPLVVTGDVTVVTGGLLTHTANAGSEDNKLTLTVGGGLVLDAGASANANEKGYGAGQGPGKPIGDAVAGASHGGRGGVWTGAAGPTYGSICAPTNCGSGANAAGGGVVRLTVAGGVTLDGAISANGGSPNNNGGAGGSVFLTAGSLTGSGSLSAKGGPATTFTDKGDGGGGRIAVILTGGESFGSVSMSVTATDGTGANGSPGTLYLQKASQSGGRGRLAIDCKGVNSSQFTYLLPEALSVLRELIVADVSVTGNYSRVKLPAETRMGDIHVYPGATLDLGPYDLYVRTVEHPLGGGTLQTTGGEIIWWLPGTVFLLR